jgi:tetratricopeptide (TPR) repeat protein
MDRQLAVAIAHHRSGRLDAAEQGYRSLLACAPGDPDLLHLLGVTLGQRGQHYEALELIDEALARRPGVAAYLGNRGEVLRKLGREEEAVATLRAALELDPTLATAHNNLGMIHLRQGRSDRAAASFQEAIRHRPGFAVAHVNLGEALQNLGRLPAAVHAYRKALEIEPDNAWVHVYLGHVLVELGDVNRLDEAAWHCQRACALAPELGQAQTNLGNVWNGMGRHEEALAAYRRAIALDPSLSLAWNNLGRTSQQLGRYEEAQAAYEEALRLEPRAALFHANVASMLAEQERPQEAIARYRIAIDCDPSYAESYHRMALVLTIMGRREEARTALEEALRRKPGLAGAYVAMARLFAEDGQFPEAIAHARTAIELQAQCAEAYFLLASNLRERLPDADLQAMMALIDHKYLSDDAVGFLGFGIATVLDARKRYADAVPFFERANAHQTALRTRKGQAASPGWITRFVDESIAAFTPEFFVAVRGRGSPSRRPILVVGMPRSGTTLVEQILASHPGVFGAGELEDIGQIARELAGPDERPGDLVTNLLTLDRAGMLALADRYLVRLQELDPSAQHVVDKMPGNLLKLGLIAALWPEARVIACRRDPRDIAVSCWATSFGAIRWANDLRLIGEQILAHDRLMAHWKQVLPVPPIEVSYEALVAALEPESRRLLSALDLPWDPACLEFHTTRRPVRTASLTQVRQPVYSRSVGRWKHYHTALTPLYETFARNNYVIEY